MPNAVSRDSEQLPYLLEETDAVLIVVGRALARPEGRDPFTDHRWFRRQFHDLADRHGLRSVAHGLSFRFPSSIMEWAFTGRLIHLLDETRATGSPLIDALERLAARKPVFIVTTNIDSSLRITSIGEEQLFCVNGELAFMFCRWNCTERVLPTDEAVRIMLAPGFLPVISPSHMPRCPRCGGPMTPAVARDGRFFLRADQAARCYAMLSFLRTYRAARLLVLELETDPWNTVLRGLATHVVEHHDRTRYLVLNDRLGYLPPAIHGRTIHIAGDATSALALLLGEAAPR